MREDWTDLRRIDELALNLGYPPPQPCFNSLGRAVAAPAEGFNIIDHFWDDLRRTKSAIIVGDDEDEAAARAVEMYCIDANLRFLHSSGDLLAQAVNASLNLGLDPKDCSLAGIISKTKDDAQLAGVHSALVSFRDSDQFQYIDSFVSTVKHRGALLPESHKTAITADGRFSEGWEYAAFTFETRGKNGTVRTHDATSREDTRGFGGELRELADDVFSEVLIVLEGRL